MPETQDTVKAVLTVHLQQVTEQRLAAIKIALRGILKQDTGAVIQVRSFDTVEQEPELPAE